MHDDDYDMDATFRVLSDGRIEAKYHGVCVVASSRAKARFLLAEVARRDHTQPATDASITLQRRS